MKFIFTSYVYSYEYNDPVEWLGRIKFYTGILDALVIKQHEVISIEQIDYEGEYKHNGVHYYFKRFKRGLFPFKLHRFIKSQNPDVVVIQSLHFPLQVIQLRLLLGKKTKIIIQNHAEIPFTGLKKHIQKLADRFTDAYLFASHAMGAEWIEKGNLSSIHKIHEVMEVSSVFAPMERSVAIEKTKVTGEPVFLWVGRLNDNKAPLTVVKAFLQFASIQPKARLNMIYHTYELLQQIQKELDASPNGKAIKLIGKLPHNELQYWFNSADIFISGSYHEGAGTAVCEAMSCGCMPLVTDINSFRMMTDNGRCGILYEAGNEAALLSALIQTQEMDIAQKQKDSLEYFRSNLSFEAIAKRIEEVALSIS
jgi:glycosyltransferase involved in cell wall biosynthesis